MNSGQWSVVSGQWSVVEGDRVVGFVLVLLVTCNSQLIATRADLVHAAAVEDFVRAAVPTAAPPEPFRSLIAGLGAECYTCREIAGRRLRNASVPADMRWLFWGRHHRDPEIRLRCNNLLRDLTRCPECGGSGTCRLYRTAGPEADGPCLNCGQWNWNHFDSPRECWACSGEGFGWTKGAFE